MHHPEFGLRAWECGVEVSFIIHHFLFTMYHLSSIVYYLSFIIYHLLHIVLGLTFLRVGFRGDGGWWFRGFGVRVRPVSQRVHFRQRRPLSISGFGLRVSGVWFRVSGSRFRVDW